MKVTIVKDAVEPSKNPIFTTYDMHTKPVAVLVSMQYGLGDPRHRWRFQIHISHIAPATLLLRFQYRGGGRL